MIKLRNLFGNHRPQDAENAEPKETSALRDIQEDMDDSISLLDDTDGTRGSRLQREAEKEVKSAAETSVKRLHVAQMGRCPICGENLRKHLLATICASCGWHTFDTPKDGPVRVHLQDQQGVVDGERCYEVKDGTILVLRDDVVIAKIPRHGYNRIEYVWESEEIDQRHKQNVDRLQVVCGWCSKPAVHSQEGFHMVHIAFGSSQERFCFCTDECYEAFRRMYPSRVHRDCYNRDCETCDLCIKRYDDHGSDLRKLGKDYLSTNSKA